MWLDNLKELKKETGLSTKQIADKTNLPERTANRIFSGDTDNPYVDTLHRIVTVLGGSLDDILADTKVVVATESLVEVKESLVEAQETIEVVKETATIMESERDLTKIENERLKVENANLKTELQLLKQELQHKDELLELHKFYRKLIPNN
jgi:transcriptional regulator with XRE-family HTH domain